MWSNLFNIILTEKLDSKLTRCKDVKLHTKSGGGKIKRANVHYYIDILIFHSFFFY